MPRQANDIRCLGYPTDGARHGLARVDARSSVATQPRTNTAIATAPQNMSPPVGPQGGANANSWPVPKVPLRKGM